MFYGLLQGPSGIRYVFFSATSLRTLHRQTGCLLDPAGCMWPEIIMLADDDKSPGVASLEACLVLPVNPVQNSAGRKAWAA
jgi:hypothetical protein